MSVYPSWRYHKTEEPKIIKSEKEEHKDWKHSPADFKEDEPSHEPTPAKDEKPKVKKKV